MIEPFAKDQNSIDLSWLYISPIIYSAMSSDSRVLVGRSSFERRAFFLPLSSYLSHVWIWCGIVRVCESQAFSIRQSSIDLADVPSLDNWRGQYWKKKRDDAFLLSAARPCHSSSRDTAEFQILQLFLLFTFFSVMFHKHIWYMLDSNHNMVVSSNQALWLLSTFYCTHFDGFVLTKSDFKAVWSSSIYKR